MTSSTINTPRLFIEHVVEPDVNDFLRDPADLRNAFHACISLLSLRDWVVAQHQGKSWSYEQIPMGQIPREGHLLQSILAERSKLFDYIADIGNAAKHMIRRKATSSGVSLIESATVSRGVTYRGGALLGSMSMGQAMFNQIPKPKEFDCAVVEIDGRERFVHELVKNARVIWRRLFDENTW